MRRTFYEILEVNQNADAKQIKNQYHKLALENHPDNHADGKFQEIAEAYDILSDEKTRKNYDSCITENNHNFFENVSGLQCGRVPLSNDDKELYFTLLPCNPIPKSSSQHSISILEVKEVLTSLAEFLKYQGNYPINVFSSEKDILTFTKSGYANEKLEMSKAFVIAKVYLNKNDLTSISTLKVIGTSSPNEINLSHLKIDGAYRLNTSAPVILENVESMTFYRMTDIETALITYRVSQNLAKNFIAPSPAAIEMLAQKELLNGIRQLLDNTNYQSDGLTQMRTEYAFFKVDKDEAALLQKIAGIANKKRSENALTQFFRSAFGVRTGEVEVFYQTLGKVIDKPAEAAAELTNSLQECEQNGSVAPQQAY